MVNKLHVTIRSALNFKCDIFGHKLLFHKEKILVISITLKSIFLNIALRVKEVNIS